MIVWKALFPYQFLKFCNVWATLSFWFRTGRVKNKLVPQSKQNLAGLPSFPFGPTSKYNVATLVDGDTVILTYQPSPVHRANAATLHATWRAPVNISLWPVGYLPAEISGLSPYMIMQAMSSCEMCCELPYILKKKMLHRNDTWDCLAAPCNAASIIFISRLNFVL